MKTWIWFLIAAIAGVWWWLRKSEPAAKSSDIQVPPGTSIGQIGSNIENPEALTDFAGALRAQAEPRVLQVTGVGGHWYRFWTDGLYEELDGVGNVIRQTRNP